MVGYWEESCLRSRRSMTIVFSQPPLTSTPIPSKMNEYANNGGFMYHHQQTSYYNYPTLNPTSTGLTLNPTSTGLTLNPMSTGLTQVLSTYAPGATVLWLDPKEKETFRLPRRRLIFLIAMLFFAILGGTTYMWTKGISGSQTAEQKIFVDLPNNSSFTATHSSPLPPPLHTPAPLPSLGTRPAAASAPPPRPTPAPVSRSEQIQRPSMIPRVIFSFDDADPDNEARVETLF